MKITIINILGILLTIIPIEAKPQCSTIFKDYTELKKHLNGEALDSDEKLTLVFNSSESCGACTKMKRDVFTIDSICSYLNSNFHRFELDYSQTEQNQWAQALGMKGGPFFCILDEQGRAVHSFANNILEPDQFMLELRQSVEARQWLSDYQGKFESGDYTNLFLKEYAYLKIKSFKVDKVLSNEYINRLEEEALYRLENMKFIMDMYLTYEVDVTFDYASRAATFLRANDSLFMSHFGEEQVKVRILASLMDWLNEEKNLKGPDIIYQEKLKDLEAFESEDGLMYKDVFDNNLAFLMTDNLRLSFEEKYFAFHNNADEVKEMLDNFTKLNWDQADKLNERAWRSMHSSYYNDFYTEHALLWIERALELDPKYMYMDTYAYVLFHNGDLEKAKQTALKAMDMAKKEKVSAYSTELLLEKFEQ